MPIRNIINVSVDFPYDPYTMQLSIMSRIINTLNNKQNCLLESPTGTGKTMALLCSALAWQQDSRKKIKESTDETDSKEMVVVPKIYYGTRTHKQIGQVVREMSRSSYSHIPMSILSSRKQSCINSQVLNKPDINQSCYDACKNKECLFLIKPLPIPGKTWDIESIKVDLQKKFICPFYQARKWAEEAYIVFCPYNYILDPKIRASMSINLKNCIVILDEGHNIEDICREGSSTEMTLETLSEYKVQFLKLLKSPTMKQAATEILMLINSLNSFIGFLASKLVFINEDVLKKTWDSKEAVTIMSEHKLDRNSLSNYQSCIHKIIEEMVKQEREDVIDQPSINKGILNTLSSSLDVFFHLLNEPFDRESDFRVVVMENGTFTDLLADSEFISGNGNDFLSAESRKRKNRASQTNYILYILCMNPSVSFKKIAEVTHSIILASGTLAPLTSFAKELSCGFDTSLEAGHVVKYDQTMVASVGCGPRGIPLNATYKNVETFAFQDELGSLLLSCCKSVPHGVLCFVSSFHMIEKLFKRWKATKLVEELQNFKTVIIEPRNTAEMNQCMEDYNRYIERGVVLLAVYRGKASEGIDFSDNAARLVIAVGIPYPSFLDFKINLKKEYNDRRFRQMSKGDCQYLSGKEWYSIQAYRALNQAIGRCIRHSKDWGAMIFVDERFASDYYNQGLCKWIRQRKIHFESWSQFLFTLNKFVGTHMNVVKEMKD